MLGTSDSTLVSELGAPHVPVIDSWAQLVIWSFDQSACVRYIERPNVRNGRDDIDCQGSPAAVLPGETASDLARTSPASRTLSHRRRALTTRPLARRMGDLRAPVRTARAHSGCVADVSARWVAQKAVTMMQQGIDKWRREQPAKFDAYMQCLR